MKLIVEIKLSDEVIALLKQIVTKLEVIESSAVNIEAQLDEVTGYDYDNNKVILTRGPR